MTGVEAPLLLSAELRARTAAAHAGAEGSPFLTALAAGRVTRAGLVALLVRLLPVYEALEEAAASWAADPVVGRFVHPALHRSARLRADLVHLAGRAVAAESDGARAYAGRVAEVGCTSAPALVAHHYTRVLGDLSGGQVVRVALERSLGLGDGTGTGHLHFPGLRLGEVKRDYRTALDEAPFSSEQREELVREVLLAYRLNTGLVAELDVDLARWTAG